MSKPRFNKSILVHLGVWSLVFLSPLMLLHPGERLTVASFVERLPWPLTLCIVFYANYFFLAEDLYKGKRVRFFVVNIVMILVLAIGSNQWNYYVWRTEHKNHKPRKERAERRPPLSFDAVMTLRDLFTLSVVAALATSFIYARKLTEADKARQEAEKAKTEAELSNLRSQVNPHFLLNTLNNIYALTAFDQAKAQTAIMELSKMLRHILYDNQEKTVNMKDEADFIHNYVNLMKLRLAGNVEIEENVSLPDPCYVRVAPMIFISLVENAFKHGVSPTEPSYIRINLSADDDKIVCHIVNSNHPKTQQDRSGHGIGLTNVRRRLELSYPGRYEWNVELNKDKNEYSSKITIYDTKLRNNR